MHGANFRPGPDKPASFYLDGSGRASVDETDGKLGVDLPPREATDFIVHDPWRPVPAVGGAYGTPPGPPDRSALDARPDVLTFAGEPAGEAMTLAGDVTAELWLSADAPSFDVSCVLSRVLPNGTAIPLAQGYRLIKAGTNLNEAIEIPLRATCVTIRPGERLRLSIAGACFPAYPVNPGTGKIRPPHPPPRRASLRLACATAARKLPGCASISRELTPYAGIAALPKR